MQGVILSHKPPIPPGSRRCSASPDLPEMWMCSNVLESGHPVRPFIVRGCIHNLRATLIGREQLPDSGKGAINGSAI